MKLTELVGVKCFANKTPSEIATMLDRLTPMEKLGDGAFGLVFKRPDNKAVKFWAGDSAYSKFVEYVQHNQDNKALPKLYSPVKHMRAFYKRPEHAPQHVSYITMELLRPAHKKDPILIDKAGHVKAELGTINYVLKALYDEPCDINTRVELALNNIDSDVDAYIPSFVNFIETAFKVYDYVRAELPHVTLDMHSGNVMYRNADLVITDPVTDPEDVDLMRWLNTQVSGDIDA